MKTILVVDDVPNIRRLIRVNLEPAGYTVLEAESNEEALVLLAKQHIDAVVLDVGSALLEAGFSLLEVESILHSLRNAAQSKELRIIPMANKTADRPSPVPPKSWDTDAYLSKPFNPAELVKILNRLLQAT